MTTTTEHLDNLKKKDLLMRLIFLRSLYNVNFNYLYKAFRQGNKKLHQELVKIERLLNHKEEILIGRGIV